VTLWYRAPEILLGAKQYSTPIDIWSIGCIFAEMASKKPLFPGDSEIDEIFRIAKVMGTPNEENWPGVSELPEFQPSLFPTWSKRTGVNDLLGEFLGANGLALLNEMLVYLPGRRISARKALEHPYFQETI